ncbi:DEAD/DEAH box helicase [Streptomyces xiamenensis]|uniref:DEAD/DEAH box helicase n=1 Tax=Streptomyces xiamenensis TaxID=408015 RepID=UPI0036EA6670
MGTEARIPAAVRKMAALVGEQETGLSRDGLFQVAAARYPGLPAKRLAKLIEQALSEGLLEESEDQLFVATPATGSSTPSDSPEPGRLRGVAIDLESVVQTLPMEPFLERHVYQAALVRFGHDAEWIAREPRWQRYVALADEATGIRDPALNQRVRAEGIPPSEAWRELASHLAEADLVVAYNGTGLDFPLLRESAAAVGCADPLAGATLVDALYLAHAIWPSADSHRLHDLAAQQKIRAVDLTAHAAPDDAELLVRFLHRAAEEFAAWDSELRTLVSDACADSPAWLLMRELSDSSATVTVEPALWDQRRVARLMASQLGHHRLRRGGQAMRSGRAAVMIPEELRGTDGRVDPAALATLVHGERAEPRPPQQRMAAALHGWVDRGVSGLLEAPTGTGKSYAVLAAVLDWLAGGADRTAVIATFTKQLQSQLAQDLHDLQQALPRLLSVGDLVKGQASRLSLAALTSQLADATQSASAPPNGRLRTVDHLAFRELAVYLLLRLRVCTEPPQSWIARSVDPVDLPAFFREYAGSVVPLWLERLSQRAGDYQAGADTPLAAHTDTVREAIAGHRLILANHALTLAHLDDLRALGPDTLLIVDEAHELENAATSALSVTVDYRDLEDLLAECYAWLSEAPKGSSTDRAAHAVRELEELFDHERLPLLAARAFDARAKGAGVRVGGRTAVLASPYAGTAGTRESREIHRLLVRCSRTMGAIVAGLAAHAAEHAQTLDVLAQERSAGLAGRLADATTALDRLNEHMTTLLDPPAAALDGTSVGGLSRVVYMEELAEPEPGLRSYRFRVSSSPIDLPADTEWQRFLSSFSRVHYVSATLRVRGEWGFIRERLGLPPSMPELALPSPFNLSRQAELVCFSDFPSWAEQEDGAMRTVAHQLTGYAQEMTRPRECGNGYDGGAIVLTTARATAAGIGEYLERDLRKSGSAAPVVPALSLGNARAVSDFKDARYGGGFLVGTKGLWQGVDVSDAGRLNLVWINKLPFAPFAAPVIEARRAAVRERAEAAGHQDPEGAATEQYYLPLAALQLRQAVGRLIRSQRHHGVIIISDRKLGGNTGLRRMYRRAFLGSLDDGLVRADAISGEEAAGNVTTMNEGWRRVWRFLAVHGFISADRAEELSSEAALDRQTLLSHTRRIRSLALSPEETEQLRAAGSLSEEVLKRSARIAGLLRLSDDPIDLKPAQRTAISAVAEGRNVLGLLPTGFGKSYLFQLPALVLPGVTLVISPLVALMHDQALELNRSIGGAVRALISPLRESSSRAGKTEVADQLLGREDHGIRLVYVSPERMCQRRFRELVRTAVRAGRVSRIAVDEAHTVAQWEDFRPSMRRVGRFLAELREQYGLGVTAVTATANHSVHAALREGLFGVTTELAGVSTEGRLAQETADLADGLVTVKENPIRPELAVFRRSAHQPGPSGVAGLVERVVDVLDGHAILYCLTVKEVNAVFAHLREYIGDTGVRLLRFHGRLTEAEKSAVMSEFRDAPRQGEEGFAPVVTVATSAFGLGVNRPDIRTVFCVSPPTDLAALYQQIGRAGRDSDARDLDDGAPANTALALATSRGMRTVRFMTGQDLSPSLLRRMGEEVLRRRGSLDAAAVAEKLMAQDVEAGELDDQTLNNSNTVDRYRTGVVRAFSALADLGAITDLGDYPPVCAIRPGDLTSAPASAASPESLLERRMVDIILARPDRARLRVDALDMDLAENILTYRQFSDGPAGTWEILADLHDRGILDVSAAPSRTLISGLHVHHRRLPSDFLPLLTRRAARAGQELALLKNFFEDTTVCAQRKFADYFGIQDLPEGCCTTARVRCSTCWTVPDWPVQERRPAVAQAFESPAPRSGGSADSALRAQRLDTHAYRLARLMPAGIHPRTLWHALRGDETAYHTAHRRRVALPRQLRESRYFGGRVDLSMGELEQSLERLSDRGAVVVANGGRLRAVLSTRDELPIFPAQ